MSPFAYELIVIQIIADRTYDIYSGTYEHSIDYCRNIMNISKL